MRLVIDGQRLGPGRTGVGRCLESLLDDWAVSGWPLDSTLLAIRDPRALSRFKGRPGLEVQVPGPREPGLAWEVFGLGRLLRSDDLLLAPANLSPPNWSGRTVLITYDTLPWSPEGGISRLVRWRFGWRYRLAARRAARVIVPSVATARDVARVYGIDPGRIDVVFPGPEPEFRPLAPDAPEVRAARQRLGLGGHPYFLFVGKRSARRNVPSVLEGFQNLRDELPEVRLVFVGPSGGDAQIDAAAGVVDGGHVDESTLRGLFSGALGLVYPSNHEGFGLPVVEAQASGCPVITLRNSALVESGGDAALYLETPDAVSLRQAMSRLATDPRYRSELIELGLRNVRRFDRSAFADGVKRVIQDAADRLGVQGRTA